MMKISKLKWKMQNTQKKTKKIKNINLCCKSIKQKKKNQKHKIKNEEERK